MALESLFAYPGFLLAYPFILIGLIMLIRQTFIRFVSKEDKRNFVKAKATLRLVLIISRALIILLLLIALASPFTTEETTIPGDPKLLILEDHSASMELFKNDIGESLLSGLMAYQEETGNTMPVNLIKLSEGAETALGDELLLHMRGGDNILLITDGNNNRGRRLDDMILFAGQLNSSISALDIRPFREDASVSIHGPGSVIRDTKNDFEIRVSAAGNPSWTLLVKVDGAQALYKKGVASERFLMTQRFPLGYHRIEAELSVNDDSGDDSNDDSDDDAGDYFSQNNVFYKAVNAVEKPRVLVVTRTASPLSQMMNGVYETTTKSAIPPDLSDYDVIILDDMPTQDIDNGFEEVSEAVDNGLGMLVVGGAQSFDSAFKKSMFSSMLPVKTEGKKRETEDTVNVVLVIDISGSTRERVAEQRAGDINKALAVEVLGNMRDRDMVSVVAFNNKAYLIQEPVKVKKNRQQVQDRIAALQFGGSTFINQGLRLANAILDKSQGTKHVVLISDGREPASAGKQSLKQAANMSRNSIRIYTVSVGKETDALHMQDIADAGGTGLFFEIDETSKLRLVFGDTSADDPLGIAMLNTKHFITRDLNLSMRLEGINRVETKHSASTLLTTNAGNPVLITSRYGLGKIAVFASDNGRLWADRFFEHNPSNDNDKVISRTVNWLVNPERQRPDVVFSRDDARMNEEVAVEVTSNRVPAAGDLVFSEVSEGQYAATFSSPNPRFVEVQDAILAVNYEREYQEIGVSSELPDFVEQSSGTIFNPDDVEGIIENAVQQAELTVQKRNYIRWPFLCLAILIFLIEIALRRVLEKSRMYT